MNRSSYYERNDQPQIIIQQEPVRQWSPGIAALLSFLIPGAGQLYKGNVIRGLIWFVITGIGYFLLFIPGLILHTICIISASMGDPCKPRRF